jgi:hypothetical protein
MLERERLQSKKISKTQAVTSQFDVPLDADDVHVGPSDFVPWLTDRKWAHIRLEGTTFGGAPLNLELKLEVWDSPNSAGVVIDAVRCAKLALDRKLAGPLLAPSSYFMKSPPRQFTDDEARIRTERFIAGLDEDARAATIKTGCGSEPVWRHEHDGVLRQTRRARSAGAHALRTDGVGHRQRAGTGPGPRRRAPPSRPARSRRSMSAR